MDGIGRRLAQVRKEAHLTQEELARRAGFPRAPYISELENERAPGIKVTDLYALAQALAKEEGSDVRNVLCYLMFGEAKDELQAFKSEWIQDLAQIAVSLPVNRQVDLIMIGRVFRELDVSASQSRRLTEQLNIGHMLGIELESIIDRMVSERLASHWRGRDGDAVDDGSG